MTIGIDGTDGPGPKSRQMRKDKQSRGLHLHIRHIHFFQFRRKLRFECSKAGNISPLRRVETGGGRRDAGMIRMI